MPCVLRAKHQTGRFFGNGQQEGVGVSGSADQASNRIKVSAAAPSGVNSAPEGGQWLHLKKFFLNAAAKNKGWNMKIQENVSPYSNWRNGRAHGFSVCRVIKR